MPDAITSLKTDHRTVKALFKEYEKLGARAKASKQEVVTKIIRELSIHAAIEEQVFYPEVRQAVPDAEDEVLEGLEEHHIVKWTLAELADMAPDDERFHAKVTVLIESVRHHIEEEEGEMFPQVRAALGRKALLEMGDRLEKARASAPTEPQPRLPDTPPGNLLAPTGNGFPDRVIDLTGRESATSRILASRRSARRAARRG